MTNKEKLQEIFPNMIFTGTVMMYKPTEQVLASRINYSWLNAEYEDSNHIADASEKVEPTTKNNLGVDCIDRKEFIDWINTWDITPIIKRPLIRHVQGMPSVTPIRPKGHWTNDGYCSCCNQQTLPLDISGYASGYDSFCPNCGADMREVKE